MPPILHCDLTSKNILLDDKLTAKISGIMINDSSHLLIYFFLIDLGLSRFTSNDLMMNGHCWWAAPEILRRDKDFGPKVDVYRYDESDMQLVMKTIINYSRALVSSYGSCGRA